jgi:DNA (cytosine-5)-methyltransferase 1
MKQLALSHMFGVREEGPVDGMEVYDLFCGAGGFSAGATAAGCKVVFACDFDQEALTTHQLNHPRATHRCLSLPAELPLPVDGRAFHLHGSPPCPQFSTVNTNQTTGRSEERRHHSENLIEWYVRTALASQATSWSMEQVATAEVVKLMEKLRTEYKGKFSYSIFRFQDLGVPQTRKRLLAGTPKLIARLIRLSGKHRRRCIRDVLRHPKATHIRNSKSWTGSKRHALEDGGRDWEYFKGEITPKCDCVRAVELPAPTVTCNGDLRWAWWEGKDIKYRRLKPRETAVLQTFPPKYLLPVSTTTAAKQIGNAVPPLVAQLLLSGTEAGRPTSPSLRRPPGPIGP